MSKDSPRHPGYVKMKDTPWIKQGRQIADIGGRGILDNYNSVNVFNKGTVDSLNARNNAIYQRAFNDMNQSYNDIMNAYAARNYNRFGSLNNTPSSYVIDKYQKDFQRQMDDANYNKAVNYENLINNELNRRYNTLNMYQTLYGYGEMPYKQDVMNWDITNKNRDIGYYNDLAAYKNSQNNNFLGNTIGGAAQGFAMTGNPWGAVAGGIGGAIGGIL